MKILNEFQIDFHPVTFPAFTDGTGHWTRYDAVKEAGIAELTVEPVLLFHHVDDDLTAVDLNLHFEEEKFPEETFGIVYGDPQFEQSVQNFMHRFFHPDTFGSPSYTEQGMQGDEYVSMEYSSQFANIIRTQSSHFLLSLRHNPLIQSVSP